MNSVPFICTSELKMKMPNSQLHSLVLHQGEVLDFSALCLIPTPVSVQVDNYVSHYLGISAAKEIEIWICFIPKLGQYIAFPF